MDYAARFIGLAQEGLPFLDYTLHFCQLAQRAALDDEMIKSLYWIGANYYHQGDLPDMQGLCWREAILQFLEKVYS